MEVFKGFTIGEYDQMITLNGKKYKGKWVKGSQLTKSGQSYIIAEENCFENQEMDDSCFEVWADKVLNQTVCQYLGKEDSLRRPIFSKHKLRYCASSDNMKKGIWEEEIVELDSISKIEELTKKKYHIKIIGDCFNTRTRKPIKNLEEVLKGKTFQCPNCDSYRLSLDGETGVISCKKCKETGKLDDFVEYKNLYL